MERNIILSFKVRYCDQVSDIDYEIEEKDDCFLIHRTDQALNISQIQTISEVAILHALNRSNDIDAQVSKIDLPSF